MLITLSNAKELITQGDIILLEPEYGVKKRKWWIFKLPPRKFWIVRKAITVKLSNGEVITIEEGFRTDLSSVPQFLWGILPPYGSFMLPCLIHDWLYMNNGHKIKMARHSMTQAQADNEMYVWSTVLCDNKLDNLCRLWGVRLGGKSWWNPKK